MLGLGKQLGIPKLRCLPALMAGAQAVRRHTAAVERQGRELLSSLNPEDKVLVLITRNYGLSDPVLNMGIPRLLLERGHKVITLSHLPAHDLDLSADYPNLYWPFGQHILSGAKLVAHHPNLYAVYLTNHGCGPDTMLSYLFRKEMGEKPYVSHTRPLRRPFAWPTPLTGRWNSQETVRRLSPTSCKGQLPGMPAVMMVWIRL